MKCFIYHGLLEIYHGLLENKTLDIGVNVYSNSDVAVCIKCYKYLVKYQKAEEHGKEIKTKLKFAYSESC